MNVSNSQPEDETLNLSNQEKTVQFGVHGWNDNLCVTYVRQPRSNFTLSAPDSTTQPYSYQALPHDCIRLLRRVPLPDSNLLTFEFLTCSLSDIKKGIHKYAAISYCWGNLKADRQLQVEYRSYIPITAKVEEILINVASRYCDMSTFEIRPNEAIQDSRKQPLMIWLDAICINQMDTSEKASQIPLMANIYQHAGSVDVWLDSGLASMDVVNEAFHGRSLSEAARLNAGMSRKRDDWLYEPYSNEEITQLMWSPWFTRAWIVQEFCFGKNHRFHYGNITLTFLFLKMVHDWGSDLAFSRVMDENGTRCEVPTAPMIDNMPALISLSDRLKGGEYHLLPLEVTLCRFFTMKTSDPRDKIFAMLGLASGDCLNSIKADYDRPAPDIFLDAMIAISHDITNFSLLSFSGLASPRPLFANRPDIPSWVPDFSAPPCHSSWSNRSKLFNATALPENGGVRSGCNFFEDLGPPLFRTTTLKLYGFCCDTVLGVLRGDERHNLLRMPKFIKKAMAVVQSLRPYPSSESTRDVLRKTLIAADPECLEKDPEGQGFDDLYNLIQDGDGFNLDVAWTVKGRFMQTMIKEGTAGSRGVFWTKNGYVGLSANGIEVGDELWLVKGARVPFVLRGPVLTPKDKGGSRWNFFNLVCEAYIHGIMDGELSDAMDKADLISVYQRLQVRCQYGSSESHGLIRQPDSDKVGNSSNITIHQVYNTHFLPELVTPFSFITSQTLFKIRPGEQQVLNLDKQLVEQCCDIISRDADDIHDSCSRYFNIVHRWFPIIVKQEFYDRLACLQSSPKGDFSLLVLTIHLISQIYRQVPRERSSLEQLYYTTKGLYSIYISTGRSSIEVIQAGLLLAVYEHCQALHDATYQTLGACARMGYTLGFEKTLSENILQDAQANSAAERQRQVWWGIIILERVSMLEYIDKKLPFAIPTPLLTDILPSDDGSREPVSQGISLDGSTPINNAVELSIYARIAQGIILLSYVIDRVNGCNPNTTSCGAALLDNALRSYATLLLQSDGHGHFCWPYSICLSGALLILSRFELSVEPRPGEAHIGHIFQSRAALGLQSVLRMILDGTWQSLSVPVIEVISMPTWCFHRSYSAIISILELGIVDDDREKWTLYIRSVKQMLKTLEPRSKLAGDYLKTIEDTESPGT
ncbi:hypothetical protein B7494_g5546 [Chlorociboria aeruginascens]|nr:hypothetical protein B7494_g5546 [Chlorociboria aeruginascens]